MSRSRKKFQVSNDITYKKKLQVKIRCKNLYHTQKVTKRTRFERIRKSLELDK
jgi:hypothetical protein